MMKTLMTVVATGLIAMSCSPMQDGSATLQAEENQSAEAGTKYRCSVENGRQHGTTLPAEGNIEFTYVTEGDKAQLKGLLGFISVNYDFNLEYSATDAEIANYTGVFSGDYKNQIPYRARVYTEHNKFANFDAKVTGNHDGGGMWGYLVVNQENGKDKIDAHYVFQSGDHMGGTLDLTCRK